MAKITTVQVGQFPGRLDNYAVEVGTKISSVLALAQLTATEEYDLKVDDKDATVNDVVSEDTELILLTKRIKGA